ncbi:MAG TPA: endonuclease/exonuclease/phosphatase family protein [Capsulimonadaceae bacterium]|jgi:exonuclease III
MRVVTWNVRRAAAKSDAWSVLEELDPDIALLQEVCRIPTQIASRYNVVLQTALGKTGNPQKFGTAILAKGLTPQSLPLTSEYDWVSQELESYAGNLVSRRLLGTIEETPVSVISAYSPAWPLDKSKYPELEVAQVKLTKNPKLWVTDILWSALKNANLNDTPWIVGGDLNTSESFDLTFGRGNKEYLDRMTALGLTDCLRSFTGRAVPTFRHTRGHVEHQMDHLYVTHSLLSKLTNCFVTDEKLVFGNSISDHLPIVADFTT